MKATTASRLAGSALVLAGALLSGCQSLPGAEISQARASIAAAEMAAGDGDAVPELDRARNKLALARRWVAARDYGPARWLAEQAEVDAELAIARHASREAQQAL